MIVNFKYPKEYDLQDLSDLELHPESNMLMNNFLKFTTFLTSDLARPFEHAPSSEEELYSFLSAEVLLGIVKAYLEENHFNLDLEEGPFADCDRGDSLKALILSPINLALQLHFHGVLANFGFHLKFDEILQGMIETQEGLELVEKLFVFISLNPSKEQEEELGTFLDLPIFLQIIQAQVDQILKNFENSRKYFEKNWIADPCDSNWEKFLLTYPTIPESTAIKFFLPVESNDEGFTKEILSYLPPKILSLGNALNPLDISLIFRIYINVIQSQYSYDWKSKMFVFKGETPVKKLEIPSSRMVLSEKEWHTVGNSSLRCGICSKDFRSLVDKSRFHISKCGNPESKNPHYFHSQCLSQAYFSANYNCACCKFDLFDDQMEFTNELFRSMANEKEKIAEKFQVFCFCMREFQALQLLSEFAKISISFEELSSVIKNMKSYLETNTHAKMQEFVEILEICASTKHFFDISKKELYNEIVSRKHPASDDEGFSILINSNNEFLSRLSDSQVVEVLVAFASKKELLSSSLSYFNFTFQQMLFVSRRLPDELIAKLVICSLENPLLLNSFRNFGLNSFKKDESFSILKELAQKKEASISCLSLLKLDMENLSKSQILEVISGIKENHEKFAIISAILAASVSLNEEFSLEELKEILDLIHDNSANLPNTECLKSVVLAFNALMKKSFAKLSPAESEELYHGYFDHESFSSCCILLMLNSPRDANFIPRLIELVRILPNRSLIRILYSEGIITAEIFQDILHSAKESEITSKILDAEGLKFIAKDFSSEQLEMLVKEVQEMNLMKQFSILFLFLSPENTARITDSEYEEVKKAVFFPEVENEDQSSILNWINSNLFLYKFPASLFYTMENAKEFNFENVLSAAIFQNPNLSAYPNVSPKGAIEVVRYLSGIPVPEREKWVELILPEADDHFFAVFKLQLVICLLEKTKKNKTFKRSNSCCSSSPPLTSLETFLAKYGKDSNLFCQEYNKNRDKFNQIILTFDFDEVLEKFLEI